MAASLENTSPIGRTYWFAISGFDAVRVPAGAVLLLAAVLKARQLASGPIVESSFFTSRGFLIFVVEFEFFLGIWLLVGLFPFALRWAALIWFVLLFGYALSHVAGGAKSCACFGFVDVAPWFAALFDIAAAAGLWFLPPKISYPPPCNKHTYTSIGIVRPNPSVFCIGGYGRQCHVDRTRGRRPSCAVGLGA